MRGEPSGQEALFSSRSPEARVPTTHPMRALQRTADAVRATLSPVCDAMDRTEAAPRFHPSVS